MRSKKSVSESIHSRILIQKIIPKLISYGMSSDCNDCSNCPFYARQFNIFGRTQCAFVREIYNCSDALIIDVAGMGK